jgi:acyl-coenzyme A synthetase/AMP-(fatty) acid ligase
MRATRRPTGASRPDLYFAGDGAKLDDDGYFWILGRVDDVLNVAGHRIGTMEVESALVSPRRRRGRRRGRPTT